MSLTPEEIKKIARLARLRVSEEEITHLQGHFSGLFALVDELQSIDTEGVAPMSHAQDIALRLREDKVTEVNRREALQSVAPQAEKGLYLVPKVIE
ncbi:Asp-tRNA(Asn)/Glu-tRNA(Gln) amidotransferase subunit GatC [Leeia sp. TBRC 13508]|uniref:Aspartyl/glutamyl-tRNA(Asn/Gln) amidotransferase subunit C n=1 Tax=Leeia speluncae TaxID=2884804 RepID=A0ABS8D7F9_9NEIS|nr:Asp-tRNA(Asn)/Glu-tRNA(Gln) amidotransferase subunit GatC [Leeia speluncae]MCB6184101.1 Asp-tRNA(Asn)/Glu-tRNA(Gln) amidotransferase subunit GatC [Leeia speluncae]